jgi:salicylate 5-hydroxylase small subunit
MVSLEVRAAVDDLYARYVKCLDDAHFGEWPAFFTEQCVYKIQARENFERGLPLALLSFESRAMLEDRVFGITTTLYHQPYYQRHIVSGLLMENAADGSLRVEANYAVFRTKQGALTDVLNVGRYIDDIVGVEGVLKFRQKLCVYDSELVPNSLIYPI